MAIVKVITCAPLVSILALAILTGCLRPESPVRPVARADAAVFAAIVEYLGPRLADTLTLRDSTIAYDVYRVGAATMGQPRDSVPAGLRDRLAQVSRRRQPSQSLPINYPVRVLPARRRADSSAAALSLTAPLPRRLHVYAFTPVAFSGDSTNAYVYYEVFCGSMCGGGEGLWLTRSTPDGRWRVRYVARYWIS